MSQTETTSKGRTFDKEEVLISDICLPLILHEYLNLSIPIKEKTPIPSFLCETTL